MATEINEDYYGVIAQSPEKAIREALYLLDRIACALERINENG